MKKKALSLFVGSLLILTCAILIWQRRLGNGTTETETENFHKQLGTYCLDLSKTDLGPYSSDSNLYQNLQVTFKEDSTFIFNMKVPFIYDSVGRWKAAGGGVEDWNWLWYKSWGKVNLNTGDQFTPPWTADSVFYLNSTTPQQGQKNIQKIFFKKIKRK